MRFLISAGEASGELYGVGLIHALRRRDPSAEFFGVAGDRMRAAGCRTIVDAHQISVVGLAEVVTHLPFIYRQFRHLVREADARRPDAAILIDFPDFNLRLARELHKRGIPVIYYVSPQLWAWRSGRIEQIRRYVRKMLVIFPFEQDWYRERGVAAEYVGHPLADEPLPSIPREEFAMRYELNPRKPWIALLPGSRRKEVSLNLPGLLGAAAILDAPALLRYASQPHDILTSNMADRAVSAVRTATSSRITQEDARTIRETLTANSSGQSPYELLLPVAPTISAEEVSAQLGSLGDHIHLTTDARATLMHSRAAAVASGTATVEAALIGTPFVMVYRVSSLTWKIGRPMVGVQRFAMPNLIAGQDLDVVTELVQEDFTPGAVVRELYKIIPDGPDRERMLAGLTEVRSRLSAPQHDAHSTAADRAAAAVLSTLNSPVTPHI